MEAEFGSSTKQSTSKSGGRKRKAANEDIAEPKKRKVEDATGALGEKEAEVLQNEDGALGEDEEQVWRKDSFKYQDQARVFARWPLLGRYMHLMADEDHWLNELWCRKSVGMLGDGFRRALR
jgi:hypothetical protein